MATEYTSNYNLDLYASADKPNLRDQYNAAMRKIDSGMKGIGDKADAATTNVNAMTETIAQVRKDMDKVKADSTSIVEKADNAQNLANQANTTANEASNKIEGIKSIADNALSLAKTNEQDISLNDKDIVDLQKKQAATDSEVTAINGRVTALENNQGGGSGGGVTGEYAPVRHAAATTQYGGANSTQFGHVKLSDDYTNTSQSSSSTAATPYALKSAVDYLNNEITSKLGEQESMPISINWDTSKVDVSTSNAYYKNGMVMIYCSTKTQFTGKSKVQIGTISSTKYRPVIDVLVPACGNASDVGDWNTAACFFAIGSNGQIAVNPGGHTYNGISCFATYVAQG